MFDLPEPGGMIPKQEAGEDTEEEEYPDYQQHPPYYFPISEEEEQEEEEEEEFLARKEGEENTINVLIRPRKLTADTVVKVKYGKLSRADGRKVIRS